MITQVSNPPQPEAKKPEAKHANKYEEHHVLFQPPKTENDNDEHGKNSESSGNSGNSEDSVDTNGNKEKTLHAGEHVFHSGKHAAPTGEHALHTGEHALHSGDHTFPTGKHAVHTGEHALHTGEHVRHTGENEISENSDNIRRKESSSPASEHVTFNDVRKVTVYRNVGCYKDALPRAVPLLEGWLDSNKHYTVPLGTICCYRKITAQPKDMLVRSQDSFQLSLDYFS